MLPTRQGRRLPANPRASKRGVCLPRWRVNPECLPLLVLSLYIAVHISLSSFLLGTTVDNLASPSGPPSARKEMSGGEILRPGSPEKWAAALSRGTQDGSGASAKAGGRGLPPLPVGGSRGRDKHDASTMLGGMQQMCSRGVAPSDWQRYCCTGSFACHASGEAIACDRVNDDYCDCRDGSDEPGTSACSMLSSVHFRCGDGLRIPTSYIDDGVCDCCDGTDEPPSRSCPTTCPGSRPP
mmetsp:Transcript_21286/g.59166  ORF Transcript_21286/g.59166 Transcript_21286/m.59166 type:complete len:239 (+) Transcript_21286:233-949(+)